MPTEGDVPSRCSPGRPERGVPSLEPVGYLLRATPDAGGQMGDGIDDDTFLHLVDAWWGGEVVRRRAAGLVDEDGEVELEGDENIEEGFDAFVACKGDLFRNSADLAMHLEEWVALHGGSHHPEARRLLEDVLEMWRSIEPKRRGPAKKRRA